MSKQHQPGKTKLPQRPVLDCLAQEHRHMAALLELLEQRVASRKKLAAGDLYLVSDVIGYLHDFPDQVHHPTENLLFDRLLERRPDLAHDLSGLRQEHEQLAAETLGLLDALDQAIAAGGVSGQSSFRTQVRRFVALQRAHMEREGRDVFGAAKTHLLEADWRVLEQRTQLHQDPLFGAGIQPRQRLLFEFLVHPERRSVAAMLASGMDVQERLLDMVAAVESGATEALGILENASRALVGEARDLLVGERHYADPWQRIFWPWHCGKLLSHTAWHSGGALLQASGKTAKQVLVAALHRSQSGTQP